MGALARIALVLLWVGCGADSGGSAADGGQSDDGGTGGGGSLTRQEAIDACVVVGSCFGEGVGDCFQDVLPLLSERAVDCALAASPDCAAVQSCLGFEIAAAPGCTPGGSCDGDVAVSCFDNTVSRVDCTNDFAVTGPTCVESGTSATCAADVCTSSAEGCDGTKILVCNGNGTFLLQADCAANGWTCDDSGAEPRCSDGTSIACSGTESRCDGTTLIDCERGFELALACDQHIEARTCFDYDNGAGGTFSACGFADECNPLEAKAGETCNGTEISFCASGLQTTVDCTAYGFASCSGDSVFGSRCSP